MALFIFLMIFMIPGIGHTEPTDPGIPVDIIVDAIFWAEGGFKAKKPFGILSIPCDGYTSCRQIAKNTVLNNYHKWVSSGAEGPYLTFLQRRYAPIEVSNDPTGLNHNWLRNVQYFIDHPKSIVPAEAG